MIILITSCPTNSTNSSWAQSYIIFVKDFLNFLTPSKIPSRSLCKWLLVYIRIRVGRWKFWRFFTENDVTLGSGGVGWATGYQDYHKTYLGVDRNTQNGVWDILEMRFSICYSFFVHFTVLEQYGDPPSRFLWYRPYLGTFVRKSLDIAWARRNLDLEIHQ